MIQQVQIREYDSSHIYLIPSPNTFQEITLKYNTLHLPTIHRFIIYLYICTMSIIWYLYYARFFELNFFGVFFAFFIYEKSLVVHTINGLKLIYFIGDIAGWRDRTHWFENAIYLINYNHCVHKYEWRVVKYKMLIN